MVLLGSFWKNGNSNGNGNVSKRKINGRTIALHVRYKSLYISLPSSEKQQCEITELCIVWRTWTTTANFRNFNFKFITVFQILQILAPSTLIRFQTKMELFCSVFKKICVHTYRFPIVFARPHNNAVPVLKTYTLSAPISFPEPRSPWPAVGKRELWE